jgi:hypothetical protein
MSPTSNSRQELLAAQRDRRDAEAVLREELLQDEQLFADVMRWVS